MPKLKLKPSQPKMEFTATPEARNFLYANPELKEFTQETLKKWENILARCVYIWSWQVNKMKSEPKC